MPHFESPNSFSSRPHPTHTHQQSGRQSSSGLSSGWTKQALSSRSSYPTPLDMSTPAHHASQYENRGTSSYEDANYGQRMPPVTFYSSNHVQSANVNQMSNGHPLTPYTQNQQQIRQSEQPVPKPSNNAIAPFLQIPRTINNSGGSLSELAAQITCLFWFESSSTLTEIEEARDPGAQAKPLVSDAIPTTGFRKWVTTILSTTQVAQHVIVLALLFVYRLKRSNPTVKGKPGSEYRLLTVALMLGNKFLDDNTYTNKTWAEVSGISVSEVHVMEVEFLSNMRYSLFTSQTQWKEWHAKLGKFAAYIEAASRPQLERFQGPPRGPLTPTVLVPPPLPSPPGSTHTSPPFMATSSPHRHAYSSTPPNLYKGPLPDLDLRKGRKRSIDEEAYEPPPKRAHRGLTQQYPTVPTPSSATSMGISPATLSSGTLTSITPSNGPRLELPKLSVPPMQSSSTGAYTGSRPHQLPPIQHSGRNTPQSVLPPPVSWASSTPSVAASSAAPSRLQLVTSGPTYEQHSRQQSPYPTSANVSPNSAIFPTSATQTQPPTQLSPSNFYFHRNSPYGPVRGVKTLLQHPPSGSMQSRPTVPYESMHYQPLSKRVNERRVGRLPIWDHNTFAEPLPPVSQAPGPQVQNWIQLPQPIPQPNFRG
ncbi:MAG: hypothetical protein M1820_001875 [Bogoriella megaspora]|nr:MAG: hypothetical protein M1820_001875 [Bogoriella megaspora]